MGVFTRVVILLLALGPVLSEAQPAAPQTKARLLLSHDAARPGDTITALVEMGSAPQWHTYWRNPGDAGIATTIEWELPEGIKAGAIQWPVPHKLTLLDLGAYAYEGTEYLLIPVTISSEAKPGSVEIKAKVDWLECAKTCNPQSATVIATLTIGDQSNPSVNAPLIQKAREQTAKSPAPFPVAAKWDKSDKEKGRTLVIEWTTNGTVNKPDFFPFESDEYLVESETKTEAAGNKITLKKNVTLADEVKEWPQVIGGLVLNDSAAKDPIAFEVALQLPKETVTPAAGTSSAPGRVQFGTSPAQRSLWVVLGLAFLGGLVLNIMPCVLPVIALKILSFVNQSGSTPARARKLGIIYALGVLASFAVLAGFVIAVKSAGDTASWGMQLQSPVFLVAMITLIVLISLNLFGVFEVTLGGKTMGAASELASREGAGGAFFNGILATVLGTSCTAPFLTAAIIYALGQPAYVTILVFLTMGVGLAFPYVLLTWNPALLKVLPKPGAWMEKFKIAMGFPMLATGVWLYSVAVEGHFGTNGALWLAMYLVLVALALWIYGTFVQKGSSSRAFTKPLSIAISLAVLTVAVGYVLEKELNWRNPDYAANFPSATGSHSAAGVNWQKWSPEAVAKARAEGRPILVDFTAKWCANCQVNKRTSIEIELVEKRLQEINAVTLIGDFTRKDPVIAKELIRFERGAVPLVLVYPANPNEPPLILPEILTPNIVLEALDRAAKDSKANPEKIGQISANMH